MADPSAERFADPAVIRGGVRGAALVDDSITTDAGQDVQVSKCPNGHGMIKSPQCCAQDMTCAA